MSKIKKIMISLGAILTIAVASVIGFACFAPKTSIRGGGTNNGVSKVVDKVDNSKVYTAGSVNFQSGGSSINYSYTPNENAKSATTTAYEYCFGSTMDTTMAVTLKSIDSTGVDLKYAYSATKLDKSSTFTGESDYTPQILQNRGDKVYIYILVTPTDEKIPTTFISSVKFWYGQPSTISYTSNGNTITQTIVRGQEYEEPATPTNIPEGYYFDAWYLDADGDELATFPLKKQKFNLYARFANLPSDWLELNGEEYYVIKGTTALPTELAIPSQYNNYKVTQITGGSTDADGVFIGASITNIFIPPTVTSIGRAAFYECRQLISLKIPSSVISLGTNLLAICVRLQSIEVNKGNPVFDSRNNCNAIIRKSNNILVYGCSSTIIPEGITEIKDVAFWGIYIENIRIPRSVTSIGDHAFMSCSRLTSIDMTRCTNLTKIGKTTFFNCFKLTSIDLSKTSVSSIEQNAFKGCTSLTNVILSKNLQTISASLFEGCTALESIDLSSCDKLTTIDSHAFQDCAKLKEVKLPNSVESIHSYAFSSCKALRNIQLPSNLKYIYKRAFYECTYLTNITIPSKVIGIEEAVFASCERLVSIVVEEGNTVYDSRDNCNAIIETANNKLISGCQNTIIPNTVRSIAGDAFHYCTGLTSIIIPSSIISMADTAFIYCYNLSTVYNLSSLNIVAGSEDNGYVGAYATNVYTSLN